MCVCETCFPLYSDYGYKRTNLKTCEKMKNYDPSKNCPPGAEYLNKTKSGYFANIVSVTRDVIFCLSCVRFRLIPGDRCQVTSSSKQELNYERVPCKEHEEESGFDDSHSSIRRAVSGIAHPFFPPSLLLPHRVLLLGR